MPISRNDASRFLAQASLGATASEIASVQQLGYAGWLEQQFALAPTESRVAWLRRKGFDAIDNQQSDRGFDASSWRKLLSSPDTLRQRVALALSEILVVGIDGLDGGKWPAFTGAAYQDLLEANAFGNYRTLLERVTTSPAMGEYLTYRGNSKTNPISGAQPDENYARELMQLFTIGLIKLNPDGSPALVNGATQPTYSQSDILGLARVWTGWTYDFADGNRDTPDYKVRPMRQDKSNHEYGAKTFLGTTIPEGTDGVQSMRVALDTLFNHANVGPFIGRQLIQRLVTSNPSRGYVQRVASAFADNGSGTRGDLKAVIKAILLDDEARTLAASAGAGKLREPMLRFTHIARMLSVTSPSDDWRVNNTSNPATALAQSPLRSPSVFNFFRPGYTPPNTATGSAGLVSPEFQLADASSVLGYVTFIRNFLFSPSNTNDVRVDTSALVTLASSGAQLAAELNTLLAAGQLSAANAADIASAIDSMPANAANRVSTAITLVAAAPEYIVLR